MYYSYHNLIKKKIKEGKLSKIEFIDNYKKMGKVMMIYFNDNKKYPIREYAWNLYREYL